MTFSRNIIKFRRVTKFWHVSVSFRFNTCHQVAWFFSFSQFFLHLPHRTLFKAKVFQIYIFTQFFPNLKSLPKPMKNWRKKTDGNWSKIEWISDYIINQKLNKTKNYSIFDLFRHFHFFFFSFLPFFCQIFAHFSPIFRPILAYLPIFTHFSPIFCPLSARFRYFYQFFVHFLASIHMFWSFFSFSFFIFLPPTVLRLLKIKN